MTDIQERISAAITRISHGLASMRVPVDQTDPDVVLADAGNEIERLKRELAEAQQVIRDYKKRNIDDTRAYLSCVHGRSEMRQGLRYWKERDKKSESQVKVLVEALENLTKWNGHHNGPMLIDLMKHAENTLASIKETT